jgi:curved DNA-binding protein CbpA
MTETFYDVLGISADATTEEIQSAYRERLKEVHPDVSDDDDAGRTTRQLVEARDVLVDETERERYDRVGHAAYVGDPDTVTDAASAAETTEWTSDDDGDTTGTDSRDRTARERRASHRVEQERAKRTHRGKTGTTDADTGRQAQTEAETETERPADTGGTDSRATTGYGPNGAMAGTSENIYDVRTNVQSDRSFGPVLPTGERLSMLAIFFVLYPLLVFTSLLPAFHLVVNVVSGVCTVVTVAYLQSMPRVALWVFGGWSALAIVGLPLFGAGLLSVVGIVILCVTILPFAFSILTAWALRY